MNNLLNNLEISYSELNNLTSDMMLLLQTELNKNNPKAVIIKKWFNDLTTYYTDTKIGILNGTIATFSFDEVGVIPYSINDLNEYLHEDDNSEYKIAQHIDIPFSDKRINLIDFTIHLKSDIALNKTTTILPNGRPNYNIYSYDGIEYAKIYFEFEDSDGLITRRREILKYIKNDNSEGMSILIKDKTYDMTNPSDASLVMSERIKARQSIVDSMNLFILGVMSNYNPTATQQELIISLTPYWNTTSVMRNNYINIDSKEWLNDLETIQIEALSDDTTWMGLIIDANGTTILDYIKARIGY